MPRNSTEERRSRTHVFFYVLEESTRKLLVSIQKIEVSTAVDHYHHHHVPEGLGVFPVP